MNKPPVVEIDEVDESSSEDSAESDLSNYFCGGNRFFRKSAILVSFQGSTHVNCCGMKIEDRERTSENKLCKCVDLKVSCDFQSDLNKHRRK